MARLIDADKLKLDYDITNWDKPYGCSFKTIDRQPTVDAEPVRHGKWIYIDDDIVTDKPIFRCSECGEMRANRCNYCPNCGAKMEEESENG